MDNTESAKNVKSAQRVIEILECFQQERRELTATDIQRILLYPQSSCVMLLKSLASMGYLTFTKTNHSYFPTLRLRSLGAWLVDDLLEEHVVDAIMQDLSTETGETICLSIHDGLFTRFIRFIDPTEPIGLRIAIGQQSPIMNSAVGRAFLSTCPDESIKKLFTSAARLNKPSRPAGTLKELMVEIEKIRSERISISYGEVTKDMGAIASALQKSPEQTAFILSVAGPKDRIQSKEKLIVRSIRKAIGRHVTGGNDD